MRTALLVALGIELASGCARPPQRTPTPTSPAPSAAAPIAAAEPRPPRPAATSRRYEVPMLLIDLAVFATAIGVLDFPLDRDDRVAAAACAAAFVSVGPLLHLRNGNDRQVAPSLGRRVGYPLVGGAVGYLLSEGCDGDAVCAFPYALGIGTGLVVAAVHDWTKAHVAVEPPTPVVIIDRDRTVVGIGGRF